MAGFTCSWKVIMVWWIAVIPFVASPSLPEERLLKNNVTFIPRNERDFMEQTKDLECAHSEGRKLHLTYVINPFHNETSIGCFYEMHVTVKKCLEYNIMRNGILIMQPSNYAPCGDFDLTPCNNYSSTKSYELFQCFETYGGILSPKEKQKSIKREIESASIPKKDNSCNEYIGIFSGIPCILYVLITLIFPICIQMCLYKVAWGDIWKLWFRILKWLYSSWTTDMIQDPMSGQVSNTDVRSNRHVHGTQPFQSTDEQTTDIDTLKNSEMEIEDLENLAIETENDTFI